MPRRTTERAQQGSVREREMRALIEEAKRSGLSRAEFARRRGVPPGTLSWWTFEVGRRDRLREAARPAPRTTKRSEARPAVRWLRVRVQPATSSPLELTLGGGRVLRIPRDLAAETVAKLLGAIEAARC